jgi:hypothetical protein
MVFPLKSNLGYAIAEFRSVRTRTFVKRFLTVAAFFRQLCHKYLHPFGRLPAVRCCSHLELPNRKCWHSS